MGKAEGQEDQAKKQESPKAKEEEDQQSRQDSAALPTGPLGLRAVPKAGLASSSARGLSGSRRDEESEDLTATGGGVTTAEVSRESKGGTPKPERKKEKKHKEKKRSRSRKKRRSSRRPKEEKRSRSRSRIRIKEREGPEASLEKDEISPSQHRGELKSEPKEEAEDGSQVREKREETPGRRTDKPPEPDHPPPYRYRQEIEGLGTQWTGPISAKGREESLPQRSNKGSKKRETQKSFKKYKEEHGHGLGFYRPWK